MPLLPVSCKCPGREGWGSVCYVHLEPWSSCHKTSVNGHLQAVPSVLLLLEGRVLPAQLTSQLAVLCLFKNLDLYVLHLPGEKGPTANGLGSCLHKIITRIIVHLWSSMNLFIQEFPTPPDLCQDVPWCLGLESILPHPFTGLSCTPQIPLRKSCCLDLAKS